MLGKYKKTPRVTSINKHLEKDKIRDVLIGVKKRLEKETGKEYFSDLLQKQGTLRRRSAYSYTL